MWHSILMYELLEKIPKENRSEGKDFLDKLFLTVRQVKHNPEIEFFLLLVEKSFLRFEEAPPSSVTLTEFSRHIMGLTLLCLKMSNDKAIWNDDFIPYLAPIKKYLEMDESKRPILHLNEFERKTFRDLEYSLKIDVDHFMSIIEDYGTFQTTQFLVDSFKRLKTDNSSEFKIEKLEKLLEQQRMEQQNKTAEEVQTQKVIRIYEKKINKLPVTFDEANTKELVQKRRIELLHQLNIITAQLAISVPLKTSGEEPRISVAITEKTKAINSMAQQLEEHILKEQHQRQQEEAQKRDADQVIKDYVQLLNGLSVTFDKTTTVELVRERRDELLYQLNSIIAHNKNTVLAALATLQIDGELPQINAAIAEKTMAINSMAQQLEEHILKEQRQRQQEEAQKRDADQVIKDYVQLLNGLPVTFDKATTVELVDERRDELLHQLSTIIAHNKSEVLAALATLQINGEPPQITAAIIEKTTAINSLAQQVVLQIQLAEEHHFEQERLRTQSIQEEPYRQSELNTDSSSLSNISMMILGGFIATAGIAAVAIAFTVLNAATLGIPGIVVACIGVAAALSGIGLFATGTYKNRTIIPEELTNITNEIVFQ